MTDANQGAEQLQLAHQTAQNICVQVAADPKSFSTTCVQRGVPPIGDNVLILDDEFTT